MIWGLRTTIRNEQNKVESSWLHTYVGLRKDNDCRAMAFRSLNEAKDYASIIIQRTPWMRSCVPEELPQDQVHIVYVRDPTTRMWMSEDMSRQQTDMNEPEKPK